MRQMDTAQRNAGVLDHPSLDGAVVELVVLDRRGSLDLDEVVAAINGTQHIGAHQHAAVPERSLEQRDRLAFSDKPNGLRDGEVEFVHMADQYSRPEKFARDVTHLVTRVEPGLRTGT